MKGINKSRLRQKVFIYRLAINVQRKYPLKPLPFWITAFIGCGAAVLISFNSSRLNSSYAQAQFRAATFLYYLLHSLLYKLPCITIKTTKCSCPDLCYEESMGLNHLKRGTLYIFGHTTLNQGRSPKWWSLF